MIDRWKPANDLELTLGSVDHQSVTGGFPEAGDAYAVCGRCGNATTSAGWCGECHWRVGVSAGGHTTSAAPHDRIVSVTRSRIGKSAVTYGPGGRLAWTVVLLGVDVLIYWFDGPIFALPVILIYSFMLLPRALRDVWRVHSTRTVLAGQTPSVFGSWRADRVVFEVTDDGSTPKPDGLSPG